MVGAYIAVTEKFLYGKGFVYMLASHIIKIYSPRIRLVFAPPKAKLFDITVEIF